MFVRHVAKNASRVIDAACGRSQIAPTGARVTQRLPCLKGAAPKGLRDWKLQFCTFANGVEQAAPIPPSSLCSDTSLYTREAFGRIPRVAAQPYLRRDPSSKTTPLRLPRTGVQRAERPFGGLSGQRPDRECRGQRPLPRPLVFAVSLPGTMKTTNLYPIFTLPSWGEVWYTTG